METNKTIKDICYDNIPCKITYKEDFRRGKMIVRQAKPKDIETLKQHDKHISSQELENSINLNRIYIAEENNIFLGWLRYNLFWDNIPFMNMLYLLEHNRGKGYGKELVTHWEKEMKEQGYENVMTSTASDEYSQHFYHKLGYQAVGGFTPIGDPFEIILWKNL